MTSRVAAINACLAWEEGRCDSVAQALDEDPAVARLSPEDRGLARELALGAVTWMRLYDNFADRFLRPGRQSPILRWGLRLLMHQSFALDRIPMHAALDESVEAVRRCGEPKLVGLANAVGRKLLSLRQEDRWGDGPVGRLDPADIPTSPGVRHSLPDVLIDDLRAVLPMEDADRAYGVLNVLPPLCTRTRVGEASGSSIVRREGPWTWWSDTAEALRQVDDGSRLVVQDRAQGEVAEVARIRPGERVLDLCAAPGGKSRAIADAHGWVVAADAARAKIADLEAALHPLVMDGRAPALAPGSFDVVVVDAPCSNSGVLARRPEARWRYDRKHLEGLERLQRSLIRSAATLVADGGRLVYATCSLSPRENQAIAHQLDGWRIWGEKITWPNGWGLGGYACCLVRS